MRAPRTAEQKKIKARLAEMGITAKAMAEQIGLAKSTVYNAISGVGTNDNIPTRQRIESFLGIAVWSEAKSSSAEVQLANQTAKES